MDKSIKEGKKSQRIKSNKKQFKVTVAYLTGYNGIFSVANKVFKFYFAFSSTNVVYGFVGSTISPRAYEFDSINVEIKRNILGERFSQKKNLHI